MADNFDTMLANATDNWLDTFGEDVEYWPVGATSGRQIKAVVQRHVNEDLEGAPHGHAPRITVHVANDGTTGILGTEVDRGGDEIKLAVRQGGTPEKRPINEILEQDAGMLQLELR